MPPLAYLQSRNQYAPINGEGNISEICCGVKRGSRQSTVQRTKFQLPRLTSQVREYTKAAEP